MKIRTVIVMTLIVTVSGVVFGDSWSISPHYLRLNQANLNGHTDNIGVGVCYNWQLNPDASFGVEGIGSWDEDADIYGGGVNFKQILTAYGDVSMYGGGYADYVYARNLPSGMSSKNGLIYGPLLGIKMPIGSSNNLFAQYQYGWIDGGNLRKAFDEANWFVIGFEMKF